MIFRNLAIAFFSCFVLLADCRGTTAVPPQKAKRVLFLGNSYTSVNDLPETFARLARAGNHGVFVDRYTPGGWTLAQHASSKQVLEKIEKGKWDYVVLQEQSIIPAVEHARAQQMYPAVRFLNDKIQRAGARTLIYETWGRRDGLTQFGFKTYSEMQEQLNRAYEGIARELGALVVPVGAAWQQDPSAELWQGDGSHPSMAGTYLAACVFYEAIFHESAKGLSYTAGLPEEAARRLQSQASKGR